MERDEVASRRSDSPRQYEWNHRDCVALGACARGGRREIRDGVANENGVWREPSGSSPVFRRPVDRALRQIRPPFWRYNHFNQQTVFSVHHMTPANLGDYIDDLPFARKVADHLGVQLRTIYVGPEMADELARMIYYLDEPQADFAAINTFFIASWLEKMASRCCSLVLGAMISSPAIADIPRCCGSSGGAGCLESPGEVCVVRRTGFRPAFH